jgi:hypothetical protein
MNKKIPVPLFIALFLVCSVLSTVQAQVDKTYYSMKDALEATEQVYSLYLSGEDAEDSLLVQVDQLTKLKSLFLADSRVL